MIAFYEPAQRHLEGRRRWRRERTSERHEPQRRAPGHRAGLVPDGTKIAYVARIDHQSPNTAHVHVMNPDGSGQTPLSSTLGGTGPQWSPDAAKIAYTESNTCSPTCLIQIHTVNPDGSGDQVVTSGDWTRPHWSPDGTKFVVQRGQAIGTMNVDGTGTVVISPNPGWGQQQPDWQPVFATGYPRPKGASPVRVPLVPAIQGVSRHRRTSIEPHGPPLEHVSCNPPRQQSATLTVGTPDANGHQAESDGFVNAVATVLGNPGTPADEADVNIVASRDRRAVPSPHRRNAWEERGPTTRAACCCQVAPPYHRQVERPLPEHVGHDPGHDICESRSAAWRPDPRTGATCSLSTSAWTP